MQTANLDELRALAEILADWVEPAPCIPAVHLFGSRVRGDHRPDSDVDVRLLLNEWNVCMDTAQWWLEQNRTNYDALRARLPGPLSPTARTETLWTSSFGRAASLQSS